MIYGGNFNIYLNVIISNNLPIFNIFPKIVWKKKLNIISWLHFPISSIFFFIGFPEWKLPTFAYPYPFWLAPIPPPPTTWRTFRNSAGRHQEVHACRARSVAQQRDVGGIATEDGDVLLDPVQGGDLVHEPVVCGTPGVGVGVGVQETCKRKDDLTGDVQGKPQASLKQITSHIRDVSN